MSDEEYELNDSAASVADDLLADPEANSVEVHEIDGAEVIDCGIYARGSLRAGQLLAEICLADRADVSLELGRLLDRTCPKVTVMLDDPTVACLLSQYAGWRVSLDKFFGMTSGPIRAVRADEPVFERIPYTEEPDITVGVIETRQLPDEQVIQYFCDELEIEPDQLVLAVAPTASIAGCFQVVARSVETCLHKLFELGYDVRLIRSAIGSAFLPPVPKDDLIAIGRTNDSILYGGEVYLWVEGSDEAIRALGPRVPASASSDYGEPFASIFERYNRDFYQIDPLLFSPAVVVVNNLSTGNCFQFGQLDFELVKRSFFD